MHSLSHLVDNIKHKGVTPNYSTDRGEALHPQNKKYWNRSNRQASAPEQVYHTFDCLASQLKPLYIQMLHMATEAEVIQKLRYQVDSYDEQQEFLLGSNQLSKEVVLNSYQHIQLCAPEENATTISAYNITIHQEHGITNFLESLSSFSSKNNWETDVYSYKVCSKFEAFFPIC